VAGALFPDSTFALLFVAVLVCLDGRVSRLCRVLHAAFPGPSGLIMEREFRLKLKTSRYATLADDLRELSGGAF
jgi:hypothetical protein